MADPKPTTPTEAGRYLDAFGNTWRLWNDGLFRMLGNPDADPERYGPWKRLVVAEEPEWEYGIKCPPMDVAWLGTRESVEATLARWADSGAPLSEGQGVFRRIKQGPWAPVKQEGATDA
jgi:hypothetical protein